MLDTSLDRAVDLPARSLPAGADADAAPLTRCLTRMLDEIDYGMLLVGPGAQVLYLNHAARLELDGDHPLQRVGGQLRALRPHDELPLQDALTSAQRGLRRLVTLGAGVHRVGVSVVPLPENASERARGQGPLTLLVLGKRQVCEQLSVHGFARSLNLTPAETRVLELLCAGVRPTAIARQQNVAVSTVRTQIGSIRAKAGAGSISELVRQVAVLPPLVGALRGAGWSLGVRRGSGSRALAKIGARVGAAHRETGVQRPHAPMTQTSPTLTDAHPEAAWSPSLQRLAARGVVKRFRGGTQFITEGEPGDTLYIVLEGRLRAFSEDADGREVRYAEYGPGDYVGEMSLDGGPRAANVATLTPCCLAMVTRATLQAHLAEEPAFAFELLAKVIRRARAATVSLREIALNDVYGRLKRRLDAQAEPSPGGGRIIVAPPSHATLAASIGCTRSMVSRVLKDLQRGGWLMVEPRGAWHLPRGSASQVVTAAGGPRGCG